MTARTLRRNGNIVKKDGDDGSPESAGERAAAAASTPGGSCRYDTLTSDAVSVAESQSETEQITPEKQDPSTAQDAGLARSAEQEVGPEGPAPKPNTGQ